MAANPRSAALAAEAQGPKPTSTYGTVRALMPLKQQLGLGPYQTPLTPAQEAAFQSWVAVHHVPFDPRPQHAPTQDYDMRGFFKALSSGDPRAGTAVNPVDNQMHFPDTWKTPYHKTFSNQSIYATPAAPRWKGDVLVSQTGKVISDETPPQQSVFRALSQTY